MVEIIEGSKKLTKVNSVFELLESILLVGGRINILIKHIDDSLSGPGLSEACEKSKEEPPVGIFDEIIRRLKTILIILRDSESHLNKISESLR